MQAYFFLFLQCFTSLFLPYPIDNGYTGRRDRSHQMTEKAVLCYPPAEPAMQCASARWYIVLPVLLVDNTG